MPAPWNEKINSFREWNHWIYPGTGGPGKLPSHRFWTWGVFNFREPPCMEGQYPPNLENIDLIFACDRDVVTMADILADYPSAIHCIGNEPNFGPLVSPALYAYQFHKYEQYIHGIDPDALMMTGGITMPVPWEDWTNDFIAEYQTAYGIIPPVDIWDIHPYPDGGFTDDGATAALDSIAKMEYIRAYLDNNGYENTPIIIGEFSDGCGEAPVAQIVIYATDFCTWLKENRVANNILGWYWWMCTTRVSLNAGLFDTDRNITDVGIAYINSSLYDD